MILHLLAESFAALELANFLSVLKASLQVLVQTAEQSPQAAETHQLVRVAFKKLMHMSGALHCISDATELSCNLFQLMLFLASIPWLSRENLAWADLPRGFGLPADGMKRVGRALGSLMDTECTSTCLHLLAVFPSDAAPTWRSQIFISLMVSAVNEFCSTVTHADPRKVSSSLSNMDGTPRVKLWVTQSFITFDSMDRILKCDHSLHSC